MSDKLQPLSGDGMLIQGNRDIPVRYRIQTWQSGAEIGADGVLTGLSDDDAFAVFTGFSHLPLRLADGREIEVTPTKVGDDRMLFTVKTPLAQ